MQRAKGTAEVHINLTKARVLVPLTCSTPAFRPLQAEESVGHTFFPVVIILVKMLPTEGILKGPVSKNRGLSSYSGKGDASSAKECLTGISKAKRVTCGLKNISGVSAKKLGFLDRSFNKSALLSSVCDSWTCSNLGMALSIANKTQIPAALFFSLSFHWSIRSFLNP